MLTIGTISSGTLRECDLLRELGETLEREAKAATVKDDAELRVARDAQRVADKIEHEESQHEVPDNLDDVAEEVLGELYEYLQGFAPPFTYVGALDGDGAEIGVWPDWEAIQMAEHDRDLIRIDAGDERPAPEPDGPSALLEVTDHGNATLYARTPNADYEPVQDEWREVWSVV